jgi:curved DNA-binding protein CbpA
MPKRNAHEVLGIQPGASAATIKAAWRRLARTHHPDLSGNDPVAARRATRLMAEINAAYTELSDPVARAKSAAAAGGDGGRSTRARPSDEGAGGGAGAARPGGGPPRPRPGRPVTARLDMSDYYMPRNQTINGRAAVPLGRNAPPPRHEVEREGPRASDPTGPTERGQVLSFRRPPPPPLADSRAMPIEFGKFRGHTLGQIADFEPSYIDWITRTITRDPELLAAARVVRDDLDARGVLRRGPAPTTSAQPPGAHTR